MAEPFSIAIGALAALETLLKVAKSVKARIDTAKKFGEDAVSLINRLNAERVMADAFKSFLFDGKASNFKPDEFVHCRFNELPRPWQVAISDSVRQSARVIETNYQGLGIYGFVSLNDDPLAVAYTKDGDEERKQESAGLYNLMIWALRDKKQAQNMVNDFTECVGRVDRLLKTYYLFNCEGAQLRQIETDGAAKQLGIAQGARIRRIIAADGVPEDIPVAQMEDTGRLGHASHTGAMALQAETIWGGSLLVESVHYVLDAKAESGVPTVVRNRVRKLAALLQTDKPAEFLCLRSVGWIHLPAKHRFVFVYNYPPEQNSSKFFFSLSQALEKCPSLRPSLEARLDLACQLAKATQSLHRVGWVHKGLRSNNVVFFGNAGSSSLKDVTETLLRHPKICGFEYSRPLSDKKNSAMETDLDVSRNVYRHPDRWGKPHEHFESKHDLYSLCVILLEIGLWESVFSFQSSRFRDWAEQPEKVKQRLLAHTQRLEFQMGRRYRDVVLRLLGEKTGQGPALETSEMNEVNELENTVADTLSSLYEPLVRLDVQ